jgi:hypothetical protein
LAFAILPVAVFCYALSTAVIGLDFGNHNDEPKLQNSVNKSVTTGVMLPGWYNYPSFSYALCMMTLLPKVMEYVVVHRTTRISAVGEYIEPLRDYLSNYAGSHAFILHTRLLFAFVSMLSVFWTYIAVLLWKRTQTEAVIASSFVGLSFEVAYHIRWIAPDGVMTQWVLLAMLFVLLAQYYQRGYFTLLMIASIAAGIACGTKYSGALVLAPIMIGTYYGSRQDSTNKSFGRQAVLILIIFGASYIVTTPGTLLDPIRFITSVLWETSHYSRGHHGVHNVGGWFNYQLHLADYFGNYVGSPFRPFALFYAFLSLIGIVAICREDHKKAILFLSFPFLYIILFGLMNVSFVRNFLVLVPFQAVMAARGCSYLTERLWDRNLRLPAFVLLALVGTGFIYNALWLTNCAVSIRSASPQNDVRELKKYIAENQKLSFTFSEKLRQVMGCANKTSGSPSTAETEKAALFAFYRLELGRSHWDRWQFGVDGFTKVFGSREVNLVFYPDSGGYNHIVLMPMDRAKRLGIVGNERLQE